MLDIGSDTDIATSLERISLSQNKTYVLGIDIGGTNTRISVGTLDGDYVVVVKFLANTISQLKSGMYLEIGKLTKKLGTAPAGVCLAIAGPVSNGGLTASITNYEGTTEERLLRVSDLDKTHFPEGKTRFVNDLESCCYGVMALDQAKTIGQYFSPLWGEKMDNLALAPSPHAVLAVGTGFGAGILFHTKAAFHVYPIEFGHALVTTVGVDHPDYSLERDLIEYLSRSLYDGKYAPEYEDAVSGRGIVTVYNYLIKDVSDAPKNLHAGQVVKEATQGNTYAAKTMAIHYRWLLRAAQNLAVSMQCKGVLLAGDNQVTNDPLVRFLSSDLHKEFMNTQKIEWIKDVPVYAQFKEFNINIFGTLFVARGLANTSHL
eukprot:TRINITY_DN2217_c0_g1_i1.p1 TRINITY_DN2217_c0_g1~~TRINITY_DN2217_c0_g1_i1.p1  ORF type:complete len:374 (+),score=114.69 TRINITY_DN2217_c0_g1_i1:93-1214(+)